MKKGSWFDSTLQFENLLILIFIPLMKYLLKGHYPQKI